MTGTVNGFTINIPQFFSGGNGAPGFGLNFDFGMNPSQIAQQAYSFVNQSFSTDQGFLSTSIAGTQSFLAHQVAPIINADSLQIAQNTKEIPAMYSNILGIAKTSIASINSNISQGLQVQAQTAQASIAASNAAANAGGGGCFITTAVCEYMGLSDDCEMLQCFRRFRDEYMLPNFPKEVSEYYHIAPHIVNVLENSQRFDEYCSIIFDEYLMPCLSFVKHRHYAMARTRYKELVEYAKRIAKSHEHSAGN